jgi:DNA-binding CsgD family transcriptional regulator
VAESTQSGCCGAPDAIAGCGPDITSTDKHGNEVFGATLYDDADDPALKPAVEASLGCGVPSAVADLHDGETVLDLGSGAGADVLISAQRVGPTGEAIGLDMTDEMLDLARTNASEADTENAEFIKGYMEDIPLPDASVDVVNSNCVINLAADKRNKRRVAQMAASGLTNRDIAQALFVTPKTVEWHLGQTYRRLNVSSRRQLPRICRSQTPTSDRLACRRRNDAASEMAAAMSVRSLAIR